MSSYIDLKFINDVSSRLSQFKKKTDYLFNFRCPHCGDSQKSKTKARAYLYRVKNDMFLPRALLVQAAGRRRKYEKRSEPELLHYAVCPSQTEPKTGNIRGFASDFGCPIERGWLHSSHFVTTFRCSHLRPTLTAAAPLV